MNWYKKAIKRQKTFDFLKNIPRSKPIPKKETEEYKELSKRNFDILKHLVEQCHGYNDIVNTLKSYGFRLQKINNSIRIQIDNKTYIIDDFEKPELKEM